MTTPPEDDSLRANIAHLRRQRAYKRGLVTKVQSKIKSLVNSHLDEWDPITIDDLTDELSSAVSAHERLQSQIDELLLDDATAYDLEQAESDKHNDLHTGLRLNLRRIKLQQTLWNDSHSLVDDIERLAATADKTTSRFSSKLDVFSTNCRPLVNSAQSLHSHPAIKERIQTLCKAINDFTEIAAAAAATSTSSSPSTTSTGDTHKDRPRIPSTLTSLSSRVTRSNGRPLSLASCLSSNIVLRVSVRPTSLRL